MHARALAYVKYAQGALAILAQRFPEQPERGDPFGLVAGPVRLHVENKDREQKRACVTSLSCRLQLEDCFGSGSRGMVTSHDETRAQVSCDADNRGSSMVGWRHAQHVVPTPAASRRSSERRLRRHDQKGTLLPAAITTSTHGETNLNRGASLRGSPYIRCFVHNTGSRRAFLTGHTGCPRAKSHRARSPCSQVSG